MSELFKGYQQQFFNSINLTNKKIQAISVQSNQKKQMAFVDIKEDLTQCQKTLKLMQTQMNSLNIQIKFQYSKKVRGYKKDYEDCRKKLYKAEQDYAYQKNKQMLIGAQLDEQKSYKGKQKLLKNGQLLSDTNQKLRQSVKVMYQTQQISNNVQVQLIDHSQKMKRNKGKLLEMRDDLGHSQHKIKSIMGRIRKNKLILVGVLSTIAIVGIIVLIVHFTSK